MSVVIARNAGRINVWPSSTIARAADTEASKVLGRMTVWPTHVVALQNLEYEPPPDWLFTANFAAADYVLQDEEAAYSDLFVVDTSNWGPAAVIIPGTGITANGDAIASTPSDLLLVTGGTLVMGFTVSSTTGSNGFEVQIFNAPTYDKFVSILSTTQVNASRIADELSNTAALAQITATGAHKVAFAFEAGRIAASVDGGAAATLAYSHFATFTEIAMTVLGSAALTSLNAIADAVDDATLASLSAA